MPTRPNASTARSAAAADARRAGPRREAREPPPGRRRDGRADDPDAGRRLARDGDAGADALRARWRELVGERLPAAARERSDWPVRLDHCFARILLDDACGAPWRERVAAPAWRNAPPAILRRAVATGEALLAGEADLDALNRRSLALRGKGARSANGASTGGRSSSGLATSAIAR